MVPAYPGIRRGSVERRPLIIWAATVLFATVPASAQNTFEPPGSPPSERFAPIWERSPFTLKTVATGPDTSGPSFADSFSLAGLSAVGGKVTVYLKNKASGDYLTLADTTPDKDSGITFESLLENVDPRKVKVRLRKGGELAEVGYAQEQFQTAGSSAPVAPPGASSSALGRPPGNPNLAPPGAKVQPGAAPQPPSRRRIILPQASPPQASSRPIPEPVRTALLAPSHAPSSSIPLALRALPSP